MAVVDANYKLLLVDIGANGRASGAGVYAASSLAHAFEVNSLNIPPAKPLPRRQKVSG